MPTTVASRAHLISPPKSINMRKLSIELSAEDQKILYQLCAQAMSLPIAMRSPKGLVAMAVVDRFFTPTKVMKICLGEGPRLMKFTLPDLVAVKILLDHLRAESPNMVNYPSITGKIDMAVHKQLYGSEPKFMLQFRNKAN